MSSASCILQQEEFSEALLPLVQGLYCGDKPWEADVTNWIKAPFHPDHESAIRSIKERGTQVWLYWHPEGKLVGYGSLGTTKWTWPPPKGMKKQISIVPFVGIDAQFRRLPDTGNKADRFSHQILNDLLFKALSHGTEDIALFVHKDNTGAIRLYRSFDFIEFPHRDGDFIKMHRPLVRA